MGRLPGRRAGAATLESALVVLSDRTIRRLLEEDRIGIDPYDEALLQPSSVDVRVDRFFRVFHNARYPYIDVKQPQEELTELVEIDDERPFILHPGEFVLGSTLERVRLPDDLVARLEGKSSLGRLGLLASAAVSNASQAALALPMLCFPQVLFAGAVVPVPDMATPGRLLSLSLANRYSFEALGRGLHLDRLTGVGRAGIVGEPGQGDLARRVHPSRHPRRPPG